MATPTLEQTTLGHMATMAQFSSQFEAFNIFSWNQGSKKRPIHVQSLRFLGGNALCFPLGLVLRLLVSARCLGEGDFRMGWALTYGTAVFAIS